MDKNQNSEILDWQQGVDNFSGDEEMFKDMLAKLEKLTLDEDTTKIYEAFTKQNWAEMLSKAHSLRGIGGYIAAIPFRDRANDLREKCTAFIENKNEAAPPESRVSEDDIATSYAAFIKEAIRLKQHLASLNGSVANVVDLQRQLKEIKRSHKINPVLFGDNQQQNCACCRIF